MVSVRAVRALPHPLAAQMAQGRDPLCKCLYQEAVTVSVSLTQTYAHLGERKLN